MNFIVTALIAPLFITGFQSAPNPKAVAMQKQAIQLLSDNDKSNDDHALALLNKAITLDPSYADLYSTREDLYIERKDYASAMANLNKLISLVPDRPEPVLEKGQLLEKLGKANEANDYYLDAVDKFQQLLLSMSSNDDEYISVKLGYAVSLIMVNRNTDARSIINDVLKREPSSETAKRLKYASRPQIFDSIFGQ
ncbi:hypothetical protein [Mucilaginibacter sp. KACC 22063]|uniref:hypothetical protein n=1 Tax=Mucilaginibacter sp. KACC 22063 TaxID=3025666 RepID=UPI002366C8B3|nr:hypothetical protein [Mucilaginibacter sp. KACC 22063]WDF55426.1 hypothetical protein PQ461_21070 [Mucilaginibacter sp. KACC 22063]